VDYPLVCLFIMVVKNKVVLLGTLTLKSNIWCLSYIESVKPHIMVLGVRINYNHVFSDRDIKTVLLIMARVFLLFQSWKIESVEHRFWTFKKFRKSFAEK